MIFLFLQSFLLQGIYLFYSLFLIIYYYYRIYFIRHVDFFFKLSSCLETYS